MYSTNPIDFNLITNNSENRRRKFMLNKILKAYKKLCGKDTILSNDFVLCETDDLTNNINLIEV